jgi:hypothetical protein
VPLVFGDCRLALGILLDGNQVNGQLARHKGEQGVENLQGLLSGETACEPHKSYLIAKAEAVVGPAAEGNPGMVRGGKDHPLSNDLARVMDRLQHNASMLVRVETWGGPQC